MPEPEPESAERSIGLAELAQSVGVAIVTAALTTGLLQALYLLQNPAAISFTWEFWLAALKTWISATATGTTTYLVGQNFGFKKGYVIQPPRNQAMRERRSDVTVIETTTVPPPAKGPLES